MHSPCHWTLKIPKPCPTSHPPSRHLPMFLTSNTSQQTASSTWNIHHQRATSHMTFPRPRAHSSPKPRYSNPALPHRNTMIIGAPLTSNRSRICIVDFLGRPKSSHCSYSPAIIIASPTTDLAILISLHS